MSASYNRVVLVGNLTRDPELRYTPGGTAVTDVGMAINDRRKGANGEWVDETVYVDVTLWARLAEVASEYLNKGSSLLIEGRLKFDTWETNEGQKRSKLRVVGERMQMLGGRGGGRGSGSGGDQGASQYSEQAPQEESPNVPASYPESDDNIPF